MSVLVSTAAPQEQEKEQEQEDALVEVPIVNTDGLYTVLDAHDRVLVLWTTGRRTCAQCKTASKVVNQLANDANLQEENIHVVIFDCDRDVETCKTHKVTTYPHFTFFLDGFGVYEKDGTTDHMSMNSWIRSLLVEKVAIFESLSEAEDAISSNVEYLIGFFEDLESKPYRSFLATAYKMFGEFKFGALEVKDVDSFHSEEFFLMFPEHLEKLPTVVLFHQGASGLKAHHYDGNFSRRGIREFAEQSSSLLLTEIRAGQLSAHIHRHQKTCIAYLDYEDEHHNLMLLALEELAENLQGVSFVYTQKSLHKADLDYFGLSDTSGPVFTLFDSGTRNHFVFLNANGDVPEVFDVNELESWLELVLSNRVAKYVKKQKAPETQTGPVQVLVHDTFFAATHSDAAHSLVILHYLSTCQYSMEFRTVFHEVAAQLASDELVFAEIDFEKNPNPPGARVFNFPTVRMHLPGLLSRQVTFVGQRTPENLTEFILENVPEP
eukprot:CAMPEP_0174239172 /NCGR_PEP_ID=MMETSP0417-20130205/13715_1 /TAXON_ID=242541 /ORGANISM="Mayorella sp, Strain BSH-02190019" /LENGTH=492 /DNA_ID=CAMNT_0015318085 /DNA_START=162 /DNA_END=1637 /DNA_ORIENTATION=-